MANDGIINIDDDLSDSETPIKIGLAVAEIIRNNQNFQKFYF